MALLKSAPRSGMRMVALKIIYDYVILHLSRTKKDDELTCDGTGSDIDVFRFFSGVCNGDGKLILSTDQASLLSQLLGASRRRGEIIHVFSMFLHNYSLKSKLAAARG